MFLKTTGRQPGDHNPVTKNAVIVWQINCFSMLLVRLSIKTHFHRVGFEKALKRAPFLAKRSLVKNKSYHPHTWQLKSRRRRQLTFAEFLKPAVSGFANQAMGDRDWPT
jgi:hypothetical protein